MITLIAILMVAHILCIAAITIFVFFYYKYLKEDKVNNGIRYDEMKNDINRLNNSITKLEVSFTSGQVSQAQKIAQIIDNNNKAVVDKLDEVNRNLTESIKIE